MFDLPQPILKQLLNTYAHSPERLSPDETEIARRICFCGHCEQYWVRRKKLVPDRCPKCSKRGWDRPFLNSLKAAQPPTTPAHTVASEKKGEPS